LSRIIRFQNASWGAMIRTLKGKGIEVTKGFATTTEACRRLQTL
jgi:phosphoenolpyruvate synthase/pyruvate phosphate dikinase